MFSSLADIKGFLSAVLAALVVASLAYGWHTFSMQRAAAEAEARLTATIATAKAQCDADKAITSGVSDAYQTKLGVLRADLERAKRVQPVACLCIPPSGAAGGDHAPTAGGQFSAAHGITSDAFISLAGEAEQVRLQLSACQDFVQKAWQGQGYK